MKKNLTWMLAALLFGLTAVTLTACSDDDSGTLRTS